MVFFVCLFILFCFPFFFHCSFNLVLGKFFSPTSWPMPKIRYLESSSSCLFIANHLGKNDLIPAVGMAFGSQNLVLRMPSYFVVVDVDLLRNFVHKSRHYQGDKWMNWNSPSCLFTRNVYYLFLCNCSRLETFKNMFYTIFLKLKQVPRYCFM